VVTQHRYRARRLQPADGEFTACFAVDELENLACHTERAPDDPRVAHTLHLDIDRYGHPTTSVAIVYPRVESKREDPQQGVVRAVVTRQRVGNTDETDATWHRLRVPIETTTWELPDLDAPKLALYRDAEIRGALTTRRLLSATQHHYQGDIADDLPQPLGAFGQRALPYSQKARD
jgi:hypothetical protein